MPEWTPHETQAAVLHTPARFKLLECGRRRGKTELEAYWQRGIAQKWPGRRHWYVALSYKQAHEMAWPIYLQMLEPMGIVKFIERDLMIKTADNSVFYLKGSENFSPALRGGALGSAVMDEAAFQREYIYNTILRPMLTDYQAPAIVASSPKMGWFTTLAERIKRGDDPGLKNWAAFHYTIYDNPYISRQEIEEVKASTPENVWKQEYMAEALEYQGRVYNEFVPKLAIFDPAKKFQDHKKWPCVVGIDWGRSDATAVVWVHISPDGHLIISAEHVRSNWDVAKHSEIILHQSSGRSIERGNWVLDQSAFRRDGASDVSIADQFEDHLGINLRRSEKDFNTGVDHMKRFMRGNEMGPWIHVSTQCPEVIRAFEEWDHGDHEPDAGAAARYAVVHAICRGLTKLADTAAKYEHRDSCESDLSRLTGLRPPKDLFRKEHWDWDGENGVPIIH